MNDQVWKRIANLIGIGTAKNEKNGQFVAVHGDKTHTVSKVMPLGVDANIKGANARTVAWYVNGQRSAGYAMPLGGEKSTLSAGETVIYNAHDVKILLKNNKIEITAPRVKASGHVQDSGGTIEHLRQRVTALEQYIALHVHTSAAPGSSSSIPTVSHIVPADTTME